MVRCPFPNVGAICGSITPACADCSWLCSSCMECKISEGCAAGIPACRSWCEPGSMPPFAPSATLAGLGDSEGKVRGDAGLEIWPAAESGGAAAAGFAL